MMKKWESKKNKNNKCSEEIVVNNEHTKYPVIPNVCATLGWKTCNGDTGQRKLDWDIYWTDYGLGIERIVRRAHSYQRINHIPGMINIYRKNNLARALGRMQKLFGDTYDFFPKTWILPHEYNAVKEFLTSRTDRCVIIKPAGSAQGKGIYLALTPNMIQRSNDEMIAQEYVMKPLTIDGKKIDIRVYCLVTSVEPLRILVYNEGLVRLCTASYNVPDTSNVYDSFMHLTNYAVNKYNSNFVQSNDTANSEDVSNKRSLSWLWKWMDEQGMNHVPVWREICDIIVKTLLSTQSYLSRAYGACKMSAQDKNPFTCFEILGFDILLTDALVPILLEVNHTPSFRMDSKLDERIKTGLVLDTMRLLNVNVGERTRYYIHKAAISQVRLYGSTFDELGDEKRRMGPREMSTESYWKKYKENESQHLGNFALIYPTDDYPHQPTRGMQKVYDHVLAAANALISVSGGVYSFFNVDDIIMPMPSSTTPTIATPTTTPTTISTPSATAKKAPSSPTTVMPLLSLTLPLPASSSSAAAASLSSSTHGISVPSHHHYRSDSNNSSNSNSNNNSSPNSSRNSHDTEDGTRPSGDEERALGQVVISRRSHQNQSPGPGQGGQSQSQGQGQLIGPQGGGFNGMRGGVSFSSPVSAQIAAAAVTTLSSSASEKLTASMMMMHHHGMTPQPPGQGLGQGPGLGQGSSPRRIVTHSNVTNVSQSLHSSGSASSSSSSPPPTLQPATPTALAVSISSEKYHSYHHHPHLASIIINNKNNTSLPPPLAGQSPGPGLGQGPKLGLLGGLEGLGPLVSAACGIAATWGWAPGQGLGQKPGGLPGSQPSSSPCPFDDGPASTLAAAAAAAAAHTQRLGQTLTTTPPRHPQSSHPPRPTSLFDVTPIPIPSHHRHCSDEVKDHSMNENLANATSAISAAVVAMACAPPTHAKPSRSVTSRGQSSSPLRFPLR